MTTTATAPAFTNITMPVFTPSNFSASSKRVTVLFNEAADFNISKFTMVQFILGTVDFTNLPSTQKSFDILALFTNLVMTDPTEEHKVYLKRDEVKMLEVWLKRRMAHCEMERDNKSPKFNPDTYISMKILLLEIKEFLMGEINED